MAREISKIEEKGLLTLLADNQSYFAESFSSATVSQMLKNIDNDHPLTLGTGIVQITDEDRELLTAILASHIDMLKAMRNHYHHTPFGDKPYYVHIRNVEYLLAKIKQQG